MFKLFFPIYKENLRDRFPFNIRVLWRICSETLSKKKHIFIGRHIKIIVCFI